jgi:hypothetical protein
MRENKLKYLRAIHAVKYITVEALTIERGMPNAKKHIRSFMEMGYFQEVYQKGKGKANRKLVEDKIYALTPSGYEFLGKSGYKTPKPKSFNNFSHQVQLFNVLMGIIYKYTDDYRIEIEYHTHRFKPRPDALVKMTNRKTGLVYYFIVELERTRQPTTIMKEKIALELKTKMAEKYGLGKNFKILYVFNTDESDTDETNRKFDELMVLARNLPDQYRFAKYHDWRNLCKSVWFRPSGERVKLIN